MPARRRRFQVSGDPDDALLNLGDALKEMGAEDVTRSGPALTAERDSGRRAGASWESARPHVQRTREAATWLARSRPES